MGSWSACRRLICVVYISALVIRYKSQGGCHIGRDVATGGVWGCNPPLTVKLRQKSGKIQVKILTFSGKICVIKSLFLWNDDHFCKIQSIYIQFVCEFALENARNAVIELQKCKLFLGEDPQTTLFCRNLVWRCESIRKFLIIIITLQANF
jgi:hypothetical protein